MRYSVFDPMTARYHAYAATSLPVVSFSPAVTAQAFVAWEDIYVSLPQGATALKETSEEPSGIIAHPLEIQRPEPSGDMSLFWLALGFLARQILR